MGRRKYMYAAAFGISVAVLAVNTVHVHGYERELQSIADKKIEVFQAEEPEGSLARLKIGASVVATKSYVVLGDVSGKVSVYLRHEDGTDQPRMEGFEFYFARDAGGEWTQTESGRCTSDECTQEGLRVLRKLDAHR